MTEYEITLTYLNGCAGAAYPQTSFDEAKLNDPADYVKAKHSKDFQHFVKEMLDNGNILYRFSNGAVTYIYEFTPL